MLKQFMRVFLMAAFIVAASQNSALASYIKFFNYSGHKIEAIYVFDEDKWSKIDSYSFPLHDGKSMSFYFSKASSNANLWDIKVNFTNGKFVQLTKIDLYAYQKLVLCQDSNSSAGFCLYLEK